VTLGLVGAAQVARLLPRSNADFEALRELQSGLLMHLMHESMDGKVGSVHRLPLPHNRRRTRHIRRGGDLAARAVPTLIDRLCCLAQNLLMDHIRSSLRKDVEAEMDNTRTCVLPSASLLGELNPHASRATDSSRSSYMCRLLEEQAAAFGLEKTHTNMMQSLVDKLQTNVHRAWARRKTHDADDLNVVVDELKAHLVEMQSEARAAAATASQHIEKLTDDVRRRDDLVVKLKEAAAAAAAAANVRTTTLLFVKQ
jgi:hypothetical protein